MAAQIQIPLSDKYLGFGYKGLVFCKNNGFNNGKHGQGTRSTKMGADKGQLILKANFLALIWT